MERMDTHRGSGAYFCFNSVPQKENGPRMRAILNWCPEEDSNLHTLRHTDLNRARLPIPPSGQCFKGAHFNCYRILCQ